MIGLDAAPARRGLFDLAVDARRLERRLDDETKALAQAALREARALLAQPGRGRERAAGQRRVYRLRNRLVTKAVARAAGGRASAAGDPPASYTGTLAKALRVKRLRARLGIGYVVFADKRIAFYRHFLEYGTQGRLRTARITRTGRRSTALKRGRGRAAALEALRASGGLAGGIAPRPLLGRLVDKYRRALVLAAEGALAQFA